MYMGIYSAAFQRRWHPYSPVFGSTEAGVVNRFLFTFFFTLERGVGGGEVGGGGGVTRGASVLPTSSNCLYLPPSLFCAPSPSPQKTTKNPTSVMVLFGEPVKWSQIS